MSIILEGFSRDLSRNVKLGNCCGSYYNRKDFWKGIVEDGILSFPNLIFGGDLKLALLVR